MSVSLSSLPKTSGIYRISIGPNKFYYGSAVNLRKRKSYHLSDLVKGSHRNDIMQKAWNKYGDLVFEIIEECSPENLIFSEQKFLNEWFENEHNMNLCPTAGNTLGYKHTPEAIKKMSERVISEETKEKLRAYRHSEETLQLMSEKAKMREVSQETLDRLATMNIGRKRTEETKKKISEGNKGKKMSEEAKKKISDKAKGRFVSDETRKKMSIARSGYKHSPETHTKIAEANRRRAREAKELKNAN